MHRLLSQTAFVLAIVGCRSESPSALDEPQATGHTGIASDPRPNVLLILLDDVGVDKVSGYGMHPNPPDTPNIDALAGAGMRFSQAWAYPVCSPTRAAMLTGQHTRRFGIGNRLLPNENRWELVADDVVAMPEVLSAVGYDTSLVGKWHLSAGRLGEDGLRHPLLHGFAWAEGSLANLVASYEITEEERGYTFWEEIRNGEAAWKTTYATSEVVDDAVARAHAMQEPWLLWVALPSVHTPLHVPPADLYEGPEPTTDLELLDAMVEATDAEIGRLLTEVGPELLARTNVVLLGDNGTAEHGIAPPLDPSWDKGSVYEGGVRVPLVVAGPGVESPGTVSDALVHVVDLLPTVAAWAEADVSGLDLDGQSWEPVLVDADAPGADQLFVEFFSPIGPGPYDTVRTAVRDADFKVIRYDDDPAREELRRVGPDAQPDGPDLLLDPGALTAEEQEAWERLSTFLTAERTRLDPGW